MKKVFEPITDTVKQTQETTGAVKDTTKTIELREEERKKQLTKKVK